MMNINSLTHLNPSLCATGWLLLLTLSAGLIPAPVQAFCGFYVSQADTSLFNDVSKVALVRDGDRTVVTMAADYRGDVSEFSMVIPVVDVPLREQINVANPALLEHLDRYTAPRLVEYYDPDPCQDPMLDRVVVTGSRIKRADIESASPVFAVDDRVTIEAEYEVGEYDILILSAEQSDGLIGWLTDNGYQIPAGAEEVVGAYLKRGMKFFVARVALDRHSGSSVLRPIQIAYEDENFMLPIRLGTVNAEGQQELFVFALTRQGRVETRNYRTQKLPSDLDVPIYIKDEFGDFYRDLFTEQVAQSDGRSVFLEYAWDMAWCDPCAAEPLSRGELRSLGVMWLDDGRDWSPSQQRSRQGVDVFVTRLHLRYDGESFPEDLDFQVTGDRKNFQGRYVLRHAWRGDFGQCEAAGQYAESLVSRWDQEAQTLAKLTGRDVEKIQSRMAAEGLSAEALNGWKQQPKKSWWQRLWGNG
ncbi:MAG: DUF2330 domain-containing protein [Pseudomonadota bacterium]